MKELNPPIRHHFELGALSQAGSDVTVTASGDELARLAEWAGVDAVRAFGGKVNLQRLSNSHFSLAADLAAEIVQSCVVTLEPVRTRIARHIERELQFDPRAEPEAGELTLAAGDDDVPEIVTSLEYDLAAPLLEELVLAIDPYPRKKGAAFAPPSDPKGGEESPFAVLKALKKQG
jgi:uncharacterized metal-binding protein YceD (DUF177 family)